VVFRLKETKESKQVKIVTLLDRMSVRRVIGLEEGWKELEDGGIKKLKVGEKKTFFYALTTLIFITTGIFGELA